jgi:hypothetical protein
MIVSSQKGLHTSVERAAFLEQKRNNLPLTCQTNSDVSVTDKFAISLALNTTDMGGAKFSSNTFTLQSIGVYLTDISCTEVDGNIAVLGISGSTYHYCSYNGAYWIDTNTTVGAAATYKGSLKVIDGVVSAALPSGTSLKYWQYPNTISTVAVVAATRYITKADMCEINGRPFIVYSDTSINYRADSYVKTAYFKGYTPWEQTTIETYPASVTTYYPYSVNNIKVVEINGEPNVCFAPSVGGSWYANSEVTSWTSVASSSDGKKLAACSRGQSYDGYIYTSEDFGFSWTQRASAKGWLCIACSSDFTNLIAITSAEVYVSKDSGVSWVLSSTIEFGVGTFNCVCSDDDGSVLVVGYSLSTGVGGFQSSIDGAESWVRYVNQGEGYKVCSSADGSVLYSVIRAPANIYVYKSVNFGETWTVSQTNNSLRDGLACSSDGLSVSFTIRASSSIYRSIDGGALWSSSSNSGASFAAICMSSDGHTRFASDINVPTGGIYASYDYGASFTRINSIPQLCNCIDCSSDGAYAVAGTPSFYVYTSNASFVKYARYNWTSWSVETVDAPCSGISILEENGSPVLCYIKSSNLYYAVKNGLSWTSTMIDTSVSLPGPQIKMFSVYGKTRILTYEDSANSTRIYNRNGDLFDKYSITKSTTIPTNNINHIINNTLYFSESNVVCKKTRLVQKEDVNFAGSYNLSYLSNSSCCMISGSPAIAYINNTALYYSYFDGVWKTEAVGVFAANVSMYSMCDRYGSPIIVFKDVSTGYLNLASRVGGTWTLDNVDTLSDGKCSVRFINDTIVVAYEAGGRLVLATNDGSWSYEDVDGIDTGSQISLEEVAGNVAIAYMYSGIMYYAKFNGVWSIAPVLTPLTAPISISVAEIDSQPTMAYIEGAILKYTNFNGISWSTPTTISTCDSYMCSLKNIKGKAHVFFTVVVNGRRNSYAAILDGTWLITQLNEYDSLRCIALNNADEIEFFTVSDYMNPSAGTQYCLNYVKEKVQTYTTTTSFSLALKDTTMVSLQTIAGQPAIASKSNAVTDGSYYYLYYSSYNGSSWNTPVKIDTQAGSGDCCILRDIGGNPNIVYTYNNYVKHAKYSGGWSTSAIDATVTYPTALSFAEIDSQPAMVRVISGGSLQYSRYSGTAWPAFSNVTIASLSNRTSLKQINSLPALAYSNSGNSVKYVPNVGSTGALVQESVGLWPINTFLTLEEINGNPSIAYYSGFGVVYCIRVNGFWINELTDISASGDISLLEMYGRPAIFINNVLYIRECAGSWTPYPQAPTSDTWASFAIATNDTVSFAYNAGLASNKKLKYSTVNFISENVDSNIFNKGDAYSLTYRNNENKSIVFKAKQTDDTEITLTHKIDSKTFNSYAFIGYGGYINLYINGVYDSRIAYDNTIKTNSSGLKIGAAGSQIDFLIDDFTVWKNVDFTFNSMDSFASFIHSDGTGKRYEDIRAHWKSTLTVDSSSLGVGQYTSITSIGGNPAIAYYDSNSSVKKLKYAKKENGTWTVFPYTIDTTGNNGKFASMVELSGQPWIAYYAETNGAATNDMKVARYIGTQTYPGNHGWALYTVSDSSAVVGQYCSINVIGSYPSVSYYDSSLLKLKYAAWDNVHNRFDTPELIPDVTANVGQYTSLCEYLGRAAIAYYDVTNTKLRLTYYNGSSWLFEDIDVGPSCGKYVSLTTKDSGTTLIACYYDEANRKLKFAERNGANDWTVSTIDAGPYVGEYCKLTVIDNKEIVVYYDAINLKPKYLRYNGSAWVPEKFYGTDSFGTHCSIANIGERPHIACYDQTNQKLLYIEPTKHIFTF